MAAAKSNPASTGAIASAMAIFVLLVAAAGAAEEVTCPTVLRYLAPCVNFLRTGSPAPGYRDACCVNARQLHGLASSQQARQTACSCMQQEGTSMKLQESAARKLPQLCGVQLNVAVTHDIDCKSVR